LEMMFWIWAWESPNVGGRKQEETTTNNNNRSRRQQRDTKMAKAGGEADVNISLEPEEYILDPMMDDDDSHSSAVPHPKVRSSVSSSSGRSEGKKLKGRGHIDNQTDNRYSGKGALFEKVDSHKDAPGPQRSIEGWIVFISGVQEEAQEEDIQDKFCEFGQIKNLHLPLDRRTGFVKGYALVEYEEEREATSAIQEMNGAQFMGQTLGVDWAFSSGPRRPPRSSSSSDRSSHSDRSRSDRGPHHSNSSRNRRYTRY